MTALLFATALSLSAVAAWYSITGLMAIFAAAAIPILIMGSVLEVSKLVVASWIYRSWGKIPGLMKAYFLTALVILMFLTSMGIFGFLSKAHLDQGVPTGDFSAKIELINEKINVQKENINEYRNAISQLDAQIEKYTELGAVSRGVKVREAQRAERERLIGQIASAQDKIAALQEERSPLQKELRAVEAEVGPIKYIAALIYGDSTDHNLLESAVRVVILLIVSVFDPLAVLLLVAANWQMKQAEVKEEEPAPAPEVVQKQEPELDIPKYEQKAEETTEQAVVRHQKELGRYLSDLQARNSENASS